MRPVACADQLITDSSVPAQQPLRWRGLECAPEPMYAASVAPVEAATGSHPVERWLSSAAAGFALGVVRFQHPSPASEAKLGMPERLDGTRRADPRAERPGVRDTGAPGSVWHGQASQRERAHFVSPGDCCAVNLAPVAASPCPCAKRPTRTAALHPAWRRRRRKRSPNP